VYSELDRSLTDEQRLLKKEAHKFAEEVIRPAAIEVDQMTNPEDIIKKDSIWWEVRKKARQADYHLFSIPKALGGFEADPVEFHILAEEFGWGSPGLALSLLTDAFPAMVVLMYHPQNEQLINEIVLPFVKDVDAERVTCAGIAEPDHGSDAVLCFTRHFSDPSLAFNTSASLQGDEWVINGQKAAWVSNGPAATISVSPLTVCEGKQTVGGEIALIPLDAPGVSRGTPISLLGSRDFPQCEIFFDNVRIPKDYMLIGPDQYETAMDQFLNMAGLTVGVVFTGLARAAFEEALEYSKQRVQGGKPIAQHQAVQMKLFDMFTKVEAARAYSRAAAKYCMTATNRIPIEYSTAVKVYCTQVAFEVAHEAVQIHGACGLSNDYLVEKLYRDARVSLIGDGCNEVLKIKRAYNIVENYRP